MKDILKITVSLNGRTVGTLQMTPERDRSVFEYDKDLQHLKTVCQMGTAFIYLTECFDVKAVLWPNYLLFRGCL